MVASQDSSGTFGGEQSDSTSETRKIPRNLVYDYPIRWSKYKVLRDFVQNFYDSIGYHEWNSRFKYSYRSGELSMTAEGVSFSYEWLVPIGASTKRDGSNAYSGYFGEGFKIASLNALLSHSMV
jgi:hypothetical protein